MRRNSASASCCLSERSSAGISRLHWSSPEYGARTEPPSYISLKKFSAIPPSFFACESNGSGGKVKAAWVGSARQSGIAPLIWAVAGAAWRATP